MYLYGAGGHSKVIAEILESMGKTIFGIFDDNQCVEEIRGQRSKRDTDFGRKYLSSFRVSCNN
jgi:acetyltransferase EpsM